MCQTAANLVELVLPDQAIRQWVVSLPFALRLPVARDSALLSAVLRIIVSGIDKLYKKLGQERGVHGGATGIVSASRGRHLQHEPFRRSLHRDQGAFGRRGSRGCAPGA